MVNMLGKSVDDLIMRIAVKERLNNCDGGKLVEERG